MDNTLDTVTVTSTTMSSSGSRLGWECPKCHACHSPDVLRCEACSPKYTVRIYQDPSPWYDTNRPAQWDYSTPVYVGAPTVIASEAEPISQGPYFSFTVGPKDTQ